MSPEDAARALPVVGTVSALGFLLPGMDKTWDADPGDDGFVRRLRSGERTYLLWAFALGVLAAYGHRSWTSFWLCMAFAGSAVAVHEYALAQR